VPAQDWPLLLQRHHDAQPELPAHGDGPEQETTRARDST
jgi:hypothetical protein